MYLDEDVHELNPQGVALAWVEFALPGALRADRIDTEILGGERSPRALRWRTQRVVSELSGRRRTLTARR